MSKIRSNLTGAVDVSFTAGGKTAGFSQQVSPVVIDADSVGVLDESESPSIFDPLGVTVAQNGNGHRFATILLPTHNQFRVTPTRDSADGRIYDGRNDNTTKSNIVHNGFADIYRVENGKLTHREVRLTTGNWGGFNTFGTVAEPGETYYNRVENWEERSVQQWLRVRAVFKDGDEYVKGNPSAYGVITHPSEPIPWDAPSEPEFAAVKDQFGGSIQVAGTPQDRPAPTNVVITDPADGPTGYDYAVTCTLPAGAVGFVVETSYSDPVTHPAESYMEYETDEGPIQIYSTDMIIYRTGYRLRVDQREIMSTRMWDTSQAREYVGYKRLATNKQNVGDTTYIEYLEHGADKPSPELPAHHARINVGAGESDKFVHYWHGGEDQSWYVVLQPGETYAFKPMWMRANEPTDLTFRYGIDGIADVTLSVGTDWTLVEIPSVTVQTIEDGTTPRAYELFFDAPSDRAMWVDMHGIYPYNAAHEFGEYEPHMTSRMPAGTYVRNHAYIKTGAETMTDDYLTNPVGYSPYFNSTLHLMETCLKTGTVPHEQIDWAMTPAMWRNWWAFMAAPVSSGHPFALKRESQGYPDPFITAFPKKVIFELSNEVWNSTAQFWTMFFETYDTVTGVRYSQSEIYGLWFAFVVDQFKATGFWNEEWVS